MSLDGQNGQRSSGNGADEQGNRGYGQEEAGYRHEVYSIRVPAGKRTYFFDVKNTRSGGDYFLTITESKRLDDSRFEKHKIFLYKEDFVKFIASLHEAVSFIKEECLPDYDFRDGNGMTDLSVDGSGQEGPHPYEGEEER